MARSLTTVLRGAASKGPAILQKQSSQPSPSGPLVKVDTVHKAYGDNVVLDGVRLDVVAGEVIVIAGPSGSGKSTLLRCVNGLEEIQAGQISVGGRSLAQARKKNKLHEIRAHVGMVFQAFNLFPHMTVLENIVLAPRHVQRMSSADREHLAMTLLSRVGINEKAHAYPADLSGGQQQRVAIARALALKPDLMLFDEPTSALDPEMIREVLDVMRELAGDGMTMMIVTHEMGFAREVADRVVFMDQGQIMDVLPPAEFFGGDTASNRARAFVDKVINH